MAKVVKKSTEPKSKIITDIKSFAQHIKYARTSQGLTIEEAASLCNITALTFSKLENGSEGVRLGTALKISKMFGLKLSLE